MGPLNEQEGHESIMDAPHRVRMASQAHRVLIYTTCYNVLDGVTLTIRKLEQEILASKCHVMVLTTKSGDMKNTHLDGTHPNRQVVFLDNSSPIPLMHDPNDPSLAYHVGTSLSQQTRRKIQEFEPSVIHITVPDLTALHLVEYARSKELPLMGTYHSNIPEYMDHYPGLGWLKHILAGFFRHEYNFFQALYVPTPYIHKCLSDNYKMHRITNLRVWGRGIDLEKFSPKHRCNMFRKKLGISENDVVVCWVGRLVPEKRPDIFCHVVRRLYEQGVPFKALVIGAGQYQDDMANLPNTKLMGWLNGHDLSIAYASCDIFLFPSAVETFGNVTLEAAASGLPLVVESDCSGHLVNGNGFTCGALDKNAFYEATRTLILDADKRQAFSKAGREFALQFEKGAVMRRMVDNYSQVTDEFYYECGGRHSNRDRMFQNKDSFWGGHHPRTSVLIVLEFLAVNILRILWYAACVIRWVQQVIAMTKALRREDEESLNNFQHNVKSGKQDKVGKLLPKESVEFVDVDIDGDILNDDATTSTETVSRSFCTMTACKNTEVPSRLAIGFVNVTLFQFRMESALRSAIQNIGNADLWIPRKRKNSTTVYRVPSDDSDDSSLNTKKLDRRRSPRTIMEL